MTRKPIGICKNPRCRIYFPRNRADPSSIHKRTCSLECSRIVLRKYTGLSQNLIEKKKEKRRILARNRSTFCIRKRIRCAYYKNWLEFPDFFCKCVGYTLPEESNIEGRAVGIDTTERRTVSSQIKSIIETPDYL